MRKRQESKERTGPEMKRTEPVFEEVESATPSPDPAEAEALETAEEARKSGWQLTGDDPLHGQIVVKLKERVAKLVREAAQDPNSEANTMVHLLLLNQVAKIEEKSYQEDPRLTFTEERHRGIEFRRQAELARHRVKQMEASTAKTKTEDRRLKRQVRKLEQEIEAGRIKLEQTRRVLDQATVAKQQGAPLDPVSVYTKIAEIIGLQSPAQQSAPLAHE
jgi:hypothetical protein